MNKRIVRFTLNLALAVFVLSFTPSLAEAQDPHVHTPAVSGVPQGVPYFCANPSTTSVASGAWSDPHTWSSEKVPGAGERVRIAAGHAIAFSNISDVGLNCIE